MGEFFTLELVEDAIGSSADADRPAPRGSRLSIDAPRLNISASKVWNGVCSSALPKVLLEWLDLSAATQAILAHPAPLSALATARIIDDLDPVSYLDGFKTPNPEPKRKC